MNRPYARCGLFQFPFFDEGSLFVEPQVAVVAGLFDAPLPYCGCHGAAGFLAVGAIVELAMADVIAKIREGILEVFL